MVTFPTGTSLGPSYSHPPTENVIAELVSDAVEAESVATCASVDPVECEHAAMTPTRMNTAIADAARLRERTIGLPFRLPGKEMLSSVDRLPVTRRIPQTTYEVTVKEPGVQIGICPATGAFGVLHTMP